MPTLTTLYADIRGRLELDQDDAPESLINSWIRVCEHDLWRPIRCRYNRTEVDLTFADTTTSTDYKLPLDITAVTDLKVDGDPLVRKSLDLVDRTLQDYPSGNSPVCAWALTGDNNVRVTMPTAFVADDPEDPVENRNPAIAVVYKVFSGLGDDEPPQEYLDVLPYVYDAVLYRVLAEAASYYDYETRRDEWMALYERAVARINTAGDVLL
jgi:hypothetical protein